MVDGNTAAADAALANGQSHKRTAGRILEARRAEAATSGRVLRIIPAADLDPRPRPTTGR